jgi:hypothetical protein
MYVENPRRLLSWLVLLVIILAGVWFFLLRGGTPTTGLTPTPVPSLVAKVQAAEAAQPRVVITQKQAGTTTVRYIDVRADVSALTHDGKLLELTKSGLLYESLGSCYDKVVVKFAQTAAPFLGAFLPVGGTSLDYTFPAPSEIAWTEKLAGGVALKSLRGVININPTNDLAVSAVEYPAIGPALKVTFSYPKTARAYTVPTSICKRSQRPQAIIGHSPVSDKTVRVEKPLTSAKK